MKQEGVSQFLKDFYEAHGGMFGEPWGEKVRETPKVYPEVDTVKKETIINRLENSKLELQKMVDSPDLTTEANKIAVITKIMILSALLVPGGVLDYEIYMIASGLGKNDNFEIMKAVYNVAKKRGYEFDSGKLTFYKIDNGKNPVDPSLAETKPSKAYRERS